jgi:CRISPR-associated protein Cmr1
MMSRKDPEDNIPQVHPQEKAGYITQTRTYKVITPLYGGGEETAKADSINTVRGPEIRGLLRFWWRATRGGAFEGDLQKMKAREEEIWGSSGEIGKPGPSHVSIFINPIKIKKGSPFQAVDRNGSRIRNIGQPSSKDGYLSFPLRDEPNPTVLENVEFELSIRYPKAEVEEDIKAALWAWETFGGIGARTRRGFGALQCLNIDQKPVDLKRKDEIKGYIADQLKGFRLSEGKWPAGVPHLNMKHQFKVLVRGADFSALEVWRDLGNQLQKFRQSRNGRFGRSLWPEADEIRRLTGDFINPRHSPRHSARNFPRGKFGLPIIFEFKRDDVTEGDPQKTTLQGSENDRLASPLILRPIVCSDGAVGLAAILEWEPKNSDDEPYTPPGGLVLIGEAKVYPVKSELSKTDAGNIPPLNGQTDVLQAFLDYLT